MNLEPYTSNRSYRFHRLALAPLIANDPVEAFKNVQNTIQQDEEKPFLEVILKSGLGPLWHNLLQEDKRQVFSPEFSQELRNTAFYATSLYLFQKITREKIDTILTENAIPYAVFKGVHNREVLYDDPALRYACDVDILVSKSNKVKAIKSLVDAGFSFNPSPENISHETALADGKVIVDLHWDIMRPGRTRIDLTDEFLESRKEFAGYWALNNEAALLIMLVHPVFTKYSTTPYASLLNTLEILKLTNTKQIDWEKLYSNLKTSGVKTAAWITATYMEILTDKSLPESFMQRIKPSAAKSWYLKKWLDKNFSTKLLNYPVLIQSLFTMPAHDTLKDAIRFLRQNTLQRKKAKQETKHILSKLVV